MQSIWEKSRYSLFLCVTVPSFWCSRDSWRDNGIFLLLYVANQEDFRCICDQVLYLTDRIHKVGLLLDNLSIVQRCESVIDGSYTEVVMPMVQVENRCIDIPWGCSPRHQVCSFECCCGGGPAWRGNVRQSHLLRGPTVCSVAANKPPG